MAAVTVRRAPAEQAQQSANQDLMAALDWLKIQPKVVGYRIVVSGCSFGGIQTLLTAQKGLGARAFIAFAPAAESSGNGALDLMLEDAVSHSRAPVFVLHAKNDSNTQPTEVLGKMAKAHGGQAKTYPRVGSTPQQSHWAFATTGAGFAIWGDDALQFIEAAFR